MNAMKIRTIVKLVVSVWTQWEATAVFVIKVTKLVTVEATVLVRALEFSCTSVIRNYPFIHQSFPLFLLFSPSFHSHLFIHHLSDGPFIFSFHTFILSSLFFSLIQFSIHSFIPFIIFLSHSLISYSRLVITLHRMIIYLTFIRVIPFYTSQFVTMSIQQMCGWVTASKSLTRKVALNLMDARWEKPCAVVPLEPAGVTHVNCARRKILVSILLSYNTSWLVIF